MQTNALDLEPWDGLRWIATGAVVSLLLHLSLAAGVSRIPERIREEPVWMEMVVVEPEPVVPEPVVPEPEPEPEPVPPPPVPEVVEYAPPEPEPPVPPPPASVAPTPRVVQGLSADSFAPGTGDGAVRAGNTTAARATADRMSIDEATETLVVAYASVTNPPKVRFKPVLEVPESVSAAQIQGRVELVLTIDAAGLVIDVQVVESLHPDADAACVSAMKKSRWKAGDKDGVPVTTKNVPYTCRIEMSPG